MKAKTINEGIKHLSPRSEQELAKARRKRAQDKKRFLETFDEKLIDLLQQAAFYGAEFEDLQESCHDALQEVDFEFFKDDPDYIVPEDESDPDLSSSSSMPYTEDEG
jgi:hypothetical protein